EQYDHRLFERLLHDFRNGALQAEAASIEAAAYAPVRAEEIDELPSPGSADHDACMRLGEEALRRGQVAQAILAGGAGTRFGGMVKGLVPVLDGYTFLDFKLESARTVGGGYGKPVSSALMTSELTHQLIAENVGRLWSADPVFCFEQQMLPRISLNGAIYRDAEGKLSLAPSGHGDFYRALRESGVGEK